MVLRCTKKLLAVLGAGGVTEPGPAPDAEDWYANLLWFDRRKCLLLTHAATLFSVFEAGERAVDLRATHRMVTGLVEPELRREGLPPAVFGNLRSQELILAKTADRNVLGCMNDMAFLCEVAISNAGSLAHCDLSELNQALHRNINSPRGYRPRSCRLNRRAVPVRLVAVFLAPELSSSRPPRLGRPVGVAARSASPNLDPATTHKDSAPTRNDGQDQDLATPGARDDHTSPHYR